MQKYYPTRILIDPSVSEEPFAEKILSRCGNIPVMEATPENLPTDLEEGKKTLFITKNRGRFVKPCPATPKYNCCNYYILDFCGHCGMDCTYCVLQSYFNNPYLSLYANMEDMKNDFRKFFVHNPEGYFRIGTGEYTDSLLLEHITGIHAEIIPLFHEQERAVLEIKSKTDNIESLLNIDPKGKVITAWSLNPTAVIEKEEFRVATIEERLDAARKCANAGYKLAFHFDPVIRYPGWEKDYLAVIDQLFKSVDADNIVYISMGCLRFMPALKPVVEKRFPRSKIIYEEFIKGEDGKMRYLKPLRINIYKKLVGAIKKAAPDAEVYFCMERPDVWREVMGWSPESNEELGRVLAKRCFSK